MSTDIRKQIMARMLEIAEKAADAGVSHELAIRDQFPDWRRVLPDRTVEPAGNFVMNAKLVDRFAKATSALREETVASSPNKGLLPIVYFTPPDEKSPTVVQIDGAPDFYGLQMPVRRHGTTGQNPEWLNLPTPEPKPESANDAEAALVKTGQSAA